MCCGTSKTCRTAAPQDWSLSWFRRSDDFSTQVIFLSDGKNDAVGSSEREGIAIATSDPAASLFSFKKFS